VAAQEHFDEAKRLYLESMQIRRELQAEAEATGDETVKIGDMLLDLGRLHWLRGRKQESIARGMTPVDTVLLESASSLYGRAIEVSLEARVLFESVTSVRGIAKACGNVANAEKARALFVCRDDGVAAAMPLMRTALAHYRESLEHATQIHRRDEIAHALWGLSESTEFLADEALVTSDERRAMLSDALSYADEACQLYEAVGGPYDRRTTASLAARLRASLG
jgi:hypothetical protein